MLPPLKCATDLEQAIERHIKERTWGRVRRLRVEVSKERVFVFGLSSTYYVKQLAIQAVLEILSSGTYPPVVIELDVAQEDAQIPRKSGHAVAHA
ncbi:MAG: hypothetical protein L0215_04625 [Gemmataceae bacterium]|nr:hypothetical protein [Gemmataceae bacterium]